MVGKSGADNKAAVVDTACILWEKPLSRSPYALIAYSPLSAVSMTGNNKVNIKGGNMFPEHLGVVA